MSGAFASTQIGDLDGLGAALARMAALGAAPLPLFEAIANYGEASTRARFKNQVGPDGVAWQKSKRAAKTGGLTLVHTARMLRSLSNRATNSSAQWGSNVIYYAIHHFGGEIKKAARSGTVRLRTGKGSALLRQKDHAHLAVFAKTTHKRAVERAFTAKAHSIHMPARPSLGVNAADGEEMLRLALEVIDHAAGNGGRGA